MGSKRLDKISDYVRHGNAAKAECRVCGHSAKLGARLLSNDAIERNLFRDIGAIERRLKCKQCGKRSVRIGPAFA